jgi:hypothetical protein
LTITKAVDLPVTFPSGEILSCTFYVTPLDPKCAIVLGHNWLTHINPVIDWVTSSITFHTLPIPNLSPETHLTAAVPLGQLPMPVPPNPATSTLSAGPQLTKPAPSPENLYLSIRFVNAVAFAQAMCSKGSTFFKDVYNKQTNVGPQSGS